MSNSLKGARDRYRRTKSPNFRLKAGERDWGDSRDKSASRHHCSFVDLSPYPGDPTQVGDQSRLTWLTSFSLPWSLPETAPHPTWSPGPSLFQRLLHITSLPQFALQTFLEICASHMTAAADSLKGPQTIQAVIRLSLHCGAHQSVPSPVQVSAWLSSHSPKNLQPQQKQQATSHHFVAPAKWPQAW